MLTVGLKLKLWTIPTLHLFKVVSRNVPQYYNLCLGYWQGSYKQIVRLYNPGYWPKNDKIIMVHILFIALQQTWLQTTYASTTYY